MSQRLKLAYTCIFLDFFSYLYYYDIEDMHNPVDKAEQDVDTDQFYNLIKHNWYLQIKNTLLYL